METLQLPESSSFTPAEIPGMRKAAILMVTLGEELAKQMFQSLTDQNVQRVTEEIMTLRSVTPEETTQVLTEFYGLLETQQYIGRGGPEYARKLLTEAFGAARAEELLAQVRILQDRSAGDLKILQKMDVQQLSKFLENEHPQTVALVLAHLDARRGSRVLMHLKEETRVDAVRRLAEMRQFSPEMAQQVALVLNRRMEAMGEGRSRRSYSGFKVVAELLNMLDQESSKTILEEIETSQPQLAIGIRTLMFTFDDLLTVPAIAIREIVGAADKRNLAVALKGAKDSIRAHLYKAMSSRAVEMLKEDMETMGPVRSKDVHAAQQELLQLARRLESEGKIVLRVEAEDA
ncbi:flagellar motor switch protein FliG [Granulicella pectinivorans]|uniref:Flagellar motor switch protein FliG n=1 Tax=Granulicella pectinivorans TaxID=474950 RepID=A0A1I6MNY9_9BACT|nr:flagellar motor switch protein FliG [Granulicella pectinivorans]SFS17351.1 flagellar motor switch protein FliG [Granulicella pectinivorans]